MVPPAIDLPYEQTLYPLFKGNFRVEYENEEDEGENPSPTEGGGGALLRSNEGKRRQKKIQLQELQMTQDDSPFEGHSLLNKKKDWGLGLSRNGMRTKARWII